MLVAFWLVGVLAGATRPLTDPDVWWHIRAGLEVLQRGAVPRIDTWSIAGAGKAWTSQDWLTNVILAAAHGLGGWGWTLLSIGFAVAVAAAFLILWSAIGLRRPGAGWPSRVLALTAGVVLAGPVVGVRAQVVDLVFGAVVLWVLWRYVTGGRPTVLVWLPLVTVAWVNLHAGWVLLFLLAGAVLVGEALDALAHRRSTTHPPSTGRRLGWIVVSLVASAVALLANPNGIAIYAYPFETLGIEALSAFVGEWQPARLDSQAGQLLLAWLLLAVLPTIVLGGRAMPVADLLILVGLTFMAAIAIRFLLIAGPITAAIVAVHLAPVVGRWIVGRRLEGAVRRLSLPRGGVAGMVNLTLVVAVAALGLAVMLGRSLPDAQRQAIAREQPVEAVRWLVDHPVGERVFNRYEWGGYLGLHRPGLPVFIDGRADVYGDAVIRRYAETISLSTDPQATLNHYQIDHVLYPPDSRLGQWLDASGGWERVFSAGAGAVWVRTGD